MLSGQEGKVYIRLRIREDAEHFFVFSNSSFSYVGGSRNQAIKKLLPWWQKSPLVLKELSNKVLFFTIILLLEMKHKNILHQFQFVIGKTFALCECITSAMMLQQNQECGCHVALQ
jgi:hypothetical protein